MSLTQINTVDEAVGKWQEILPKLGVFPAFLNGKHQPCPLCGGKDRARFTDLDGRGCYYCNQCGAGDGFKLLMKLHGWDFKKAVQEVGAIIGVLPKERPKRMPKRVTSELEFTRIWKGSRDITPSSAAGKYLAARGIDMSRPIHPRALRTTVSTFHPYAEVFPVMVAKFCDHHGNGKQLHLTFLTEDGQKARVTPNRKFMPGPLPKGGAIRLGEAAETMGVAEGIETALSAAQLFKMPVWATTSASMLEVWRPPVGVKRLVIYGDNDASGTGQAAAWALYKRLWVQIDKGVVIVVRTPETQGHDFNDVLREVNDARITH